MRREDVFMDILGDLDEKLVGMAMPQQDACDLKTEVRYMTLGEPAKPDEKALKRYRAVRAAALSAAAAVLLIGTGFLLGTGYMQQWIASYTPPTAVTAEDPGLPENTVPPDSGLYELNVYEIDADYADAADWGITMEPVSADNGSVDLRVHRSGSYIGEIRYAYGISVQKYIDDEWKTVAEDRGSYWEHVLLPYSTEEWNCWYGRTLESGKYRIEKIFIDYRGADDFDAAKCYAEFEIPGYTVSFGQITDTSMPEPFDSDNVESQTDFISLWKSRYRIIPLSLADERSEEASQWVTEKEETEAASTPYNLLNSINLYSFLRNMDISMESVEQWIKDSNEMHNDEEDYKEYIFTDEEIGAMRKGFISGITYLAASEYCIVIDENVFSPKWLYYHTIDDYKAAGITTDMVNRKYRKYKDLGLTDEAWRAFSSKLGAYVYDGFIHREDGLIVFFYDNMSADRTYDLLTEHFYGKWETEDGEHSLTLTSEESPFDFDGHYYPCGVSETDNAYIFAFINGGEGGCYVIYKSEPDALYWGGWNIGDGVMPDVAIVSENALKYILTERAEPTLRTGKMSVLGEYVLKHDHGDAFSEFYSETILCGDTDGFTDPTGQSWRLSGDITPRYLVENSDTSVTVGIKYLNKSQNDDYIDNGRTGAMPVRQYFALTFTKAGSGEWSVSYSEPGEYMLDLISENELKAALDSVMNDYLYNSQHVMLRGEEAWELVMERAEIDFSLPQEILDGSSENFYYDGTGFYYDGYYPACAVVGGKVVYIGSIDGLVGEENVLILDENGHYWLYYHLSLIGMKVKTGDIVEQFQEIGTTGSTGLYNTIRYAFRVI